MQSMRPVVVGASFRRKP